VPIVSKIEKINELMDRAVSVSGSRPEQFDNFSELQKNASKDELIALTNHPNAVVRCYAFWSLTYDPTSNLLPIVINHINDTTIVDTQFGCIGSRERAGDFMINVVTPKYIDLKSKKLSVTEADYLDSILVYTPNKLYAKENAINRTRLTQKFYERVRELVLKENNQSALVSLAKFQRDQDIPLILSNRQKSKPFNPLFFTFKAISCFPNNSFLPFLKESLDNAIKEGTLIFEEVWLVIIDISFRLFSSQ
jgi:hypothetical protein